MERLDSYRVIRANGYVGIRDKFGICGEKDAIVPEHRLIASLLIGRPLEDGEVVHHLDLDRTNNSPDNLVVVNRGEGDTFHRDGSTKARKKAKRQIRFDGRTPYLKMKCPWCGGIFFKMRSQSVLAHDNKLHVNCCSRSCANRLHEAVESGHCHDLSRRVRENVVCEFNSNTPFMERYVKGQYPPSWHIDDDGVLHDD